ncbi:hypothetical protein FSPOR_2676 [Fusarium sporotrichioides]|uniref:Ferric oxidoreductase domain-containing protein n=1 Tax=Fusarium sporotrichioides TaxID=5514 RepID=A0A395SJV5_FUSSP|nr:hypothetical protein FSPOR_2676 [Fusarium sporotrichioides]
MRLFTALSLPETLILALLTLPFTASATELLQGYGRNDYALPCAQACTWATPTTLDCPEYAAMSAEERAVAYPSATCMGNDTWYLTSIAWCITSYCSKDTKPYKIEIFWGTKMIYQVQSIKFSYGEALAQVDTKTPPKPMSPDEAVLNRTISIDDATYQSYLNSVRGYIAIGHNESKYSLLVFLSCIAIPIGFSLLRFLPIPKSVRSKFYAYIIDPPAWGKRHSVPTLGLGIVPTRGQALFILYIIAINVAATFDGYPRYTPNAYFPVRRDELMRHIGNRAGIIAFANIPIIILYAGRNSLLLRLTNWSYSTFIRLHRWVAMVCVVQVILHSLMWLQIMVEAHSHAEAVTYPYWQWGIVGTVAFSLLLPFSILPFRRALYEVFLVVHICLAVVVLVGSWYHIWYLFEDTSGFEIWLIIAIAVWGYERLLRILRISRHGIKKAYITKVDERYLQIDIPEMDAHGHCFVYFPTLSWRPWENHPFSIVNCTRGQLEGEVAQSSSSSQVEGKSQSPTDASLFKEVGMVAVKAPSSSTGNNTIKPGITLFVSPEHGLTSRLPKKADTGISIPILVECSYGHEDPTRFMPTTDYPNTLAIAGGVGITAVLPALQSSLSMYARPIGTSKLYWGTRNRGLVDAVKRMIVEGDNYHDEEGDGSASNWGHFGAHVTIGSRMDIKQVLTRELENTAGGTTVIVCGPQHMCDDARNVCAALARHGAIVRYVEESFSW